MSSINGQQAAQRLERLERLEIVEKRFLEYEKGIGKVIETLQKIQDALLGRIELGAPGLLEEIRQLKKGQEALEILSANYSTLHQEVKDIKEQISRIRNAKSLLFPKSWQKTIWMILGGATVVIFLLGKGFDYLLSILKVGFKP